LWYPRQLVLQILSLRTETVQMITANPSELFDGSIARAADEDLIELLRAGSDEALTVLFDRYHRLVFHVALRIVRDPGEAEEVVQTVFLSIFRAVANFDRRKGLVRVWLLQYAYHRALHRKRHLTANQFYRWEELEAAMEVGAARAYLGDPRENVRLVDQLLQRLKPRQRSVMELTYYEGLTAEEVSQRLNESVHVVRHDLQRSLSMLRDVMLGATTKKDQC
jgi:RNA polymerase sigma-70 factor (ECF subfamily)